jgi:hypothetical protein
LSDDGRLEVVRLVVVLFVFGMLMIIVAGVSRGLRVTYARAHL